MSDSRRVRRCAAKPANRRGFPPWRDQKLTLSMLSERRAQVKALPESPGTAVRGVWGYGESPHTITAY